MGLPKMGKVLKRFYRPLTIRTVTQDIEDFRPVDNTQSRDTKAVVQPAQKEKLNPAIVDWSLIYLQVHSVDAIKIGDIITVDSVDYKAVELGNYKDYGFYETIFEQIK